MLLILLSGCSLFIGNPDSCANDMECEMVFGEGSTCIEESGYCVGGESSDSGEEEDSGEDSGGDTGDENAMHAYVQVSSLPPTLADPICPTTPLVFILPEETCETER
jgi:hypothetical protein